MAKKNEDLTEKYLQQLGKRVRGLRIKKGYSNADFFAYDHNISRSQYGRYERGEDLRFSSLIKILEIHHLTIKEFFNEGFN